MYVLLLSCFIGADMPKIARTPTMATTTAEPWVKTVKYEQMKDGKVVYTVESVGAYQTPGGAWVVNHGDIRVTMSRSGDRITTAEGVILNIDKFQSLRNGARRMLYTTPIGTVPKKK